MNILLLILALLTLAIASKETKPKYEPVKAAQFREKLKVIPKDCRHALELKNQEYIKKLCNLKKSRPVE